METVELAGRTVARIGISLAELRATGMWGEPASRDAAARAIRRAVELGVDVFEVPLPFGPAADLFREARVRPVFVVARLTDAGVDLDTVRRRLGRPPDLVLARPEQLPDGPDWGVPLGLITAGDGPPPAGEDVAAVRGPYPPPASLLSWCQDHRIPYLASSPKILGSGRLTIALPAPRGITDVERLLRDQAPTPPTEGPG